VRGEQQNAVAQEAPTVCTQQCPWGAQVWTGAGHVFPQNPQLFESCMSHVPLQHMPLSSGLVVHTVLSAAATHVLFAPQVRHAVASQVPQLMVPPQPSEAVPQV